MRRSRGRLALAAVFAILALNAWVQVVLAAVGESDDPPPLMALQTVIGAAGAAAAWGSWVGTCWASIAALLYGLVTAGMLVALTPMLELGPDARGGLWAGAAAVLFFSVGAAWYLRRAVAREAVGPRDTAG